MAEKEIVKGGLSEKTGKKELIHRILCALIYSIWVIILPMLVCAIVFAILMAVAFLLVVFLRLFDVSISSRKNMIFLFSWVISSFLIVGIYFFIERKWHLRDKINNINERLSLACFHKIELNINKDFCYLYEADSKTLHVNLIVLGICVLFMFFSPFIGFVLGALESRESFTLIDIKNSYIKNWPSILISTIPLVAICIFAFYYFRLRMRGMAWELSRGGIKILKNKKEIEFIPWEYVRKMYAYNHIADLRNNKKYSLTLPLKEYRDLMLKFKSFTGNKNGGNK